jgi:DNA-damage-inducible protein J
MSADTVVRARIDSETKKRATAALDAMGLSVSDAIRLLMLRIADEQRLPFAVQVPNSLTAQALEDLDSGKGKRFDSADELFEDLGI